MWVGNLLVANRLRKFSFSSAGNDDHAWLTKRGSPRIATRRRPLSSERRKVPKSARQRRVALSRMASKMGCKSCRELAMARSTSEMAVCCSMSSVTRLPTSCNITTVDRLAGAGNESGLGACEIGHQPGDLFRLAQASKGHQRLHHLGVSNGHVCLGRSGLAIIDRNTARREVDS